jgi:hypothetical protein
MPRLQSTLAHHPEEYVIDEAITGIEWRRRPEERALPVLWSGSAARKNWGLRDVSGLEFVPAFPEFWGPRDHEAEEASTTTMMTMTTNRRDSMSPPRNSADHVRLLLIVHPWGPDALQLIEINPSGTPLTSFPPSPPPSPPPPQAQAPAQAQHPLQCELCKDHVRASDFSRSVCVFHPGKIYPSVRLPCL